MCQCVISSTWYRKLITQEAKSHDLYGTDLLDAMGVTNPYLRKIIMYESSGRVWAKNPQSTAFGLGQLVDYQRKTYLGAHYATTNPWLQLRATKAYIRDRYGTAKRAWAHEQNYGWY